MADCLGIFKNHTVGPLTCRTPAVGAELDRRLGPVPWHSPHLLASLSPG